MRRRSSLPSHWRGQLGKAFKLIQLDLEEGSLPAQLLLIFGCVAFVAVMAAMLLGYSMFGLAQFLYPLNFLKCLTLAAVFCLPSIIMQKSSAYLLIKSDETHKPKILRQLVVILLSAGVSSEIAGSIIYPESSFFFIYGIIISSPLLILFAWPWIYFLRKKQNWNLILWICIPTLVATAAGLIVNAVMADGDGPTDNHLMFALAGFLTASFVWIENRFVFVKNKVRTE